MADCDPLTRDNFRFPRRPSNRPALNRVAYRIGEYPDMLEAMIRHIDGEVALGAWTHRAPDDPAIALLEGAAILGDILSFYQERYGNEAFMRTAAWRESVADLARLSGYRLAPALGGRATVAFEVKGSRPVTVPAGFPLKADLEEADKPAEFQTDADLEAWPHLSRFNLYRRRGYFPTLWSNRDTAEVKAAGGDTSQGAIAVLDLQQGNRIMLLSNPRAWAVDSTNFNPVQKRPQMLEVKEVETVLDRTLVTFDTTTTTSWSAPIKAYRLGRTFRHFGHGAPPTFTESIKSGSEITGAREKTTLYNRHVDPSHDCQNTSADRPLPPEIIPLDQEVQNLAVGRDVIVEARIQYGSKTRTLTVLRRITRLRGTSMTFAAQTSPVTFLYLDRPLIEHEGLGSATADIRDIRVYEVLGPEIELRRPARFYGGTIWSGLNALNFYGTAEEARALADRRLTLMDEADGRAETLVVTSTADDFAGSGTDPQVWPISFDAPPKLFKRHEFDEAEPTITVFGNLAEVSEGKAVPVEVLGNGDARVVFQTFKLPKPLTYHLSPGATPPQVPELTVYVNNRAWTRVASLYGQPPDAQVYIVREDAEGQSFVQFGDGKTGARLLSGVGNVSAGFRTGASARGPLKPDTNPTPGTRIAEVKKLHMPEGVAGGSDREEADNAREAAPRKIQGLDRLVSLSDYETELMTIPGVARVRADWDIADGVPTVVLRVLLEHGREAEFQAVRDTIRSYQRCRGPDRFALAVEQAFLRQAYLDLRYGLDPRFLETEVEAALVAMLAPMDHDDAARDGVFAKCARRLGEREYASRIEGRAQQIEGVTWAHVTALGMFTAAASRADELVLPAAPRPLAARLSPAANELLALKTGSLTLQSAPPDTVEECA